ncbi:hypothetical protein [Hyphomonas sp.]|uniref:hypothetical protein n=1 Tax=Hyphomonas sp. TaxID=87 RepID=UPI00352845F2
MRHFACLALACAMAATGAADPVPTKVRSGAYMEMIAQRGAECGLLKDWERLSINALTLQDRDGWSDELLASLKAETAKQVAETACDSEMLTLWIDTARPGFDAEMLPPYLVAYKTLAELDAPPRVFAATALRLDKAPVIAAIDAKLAELAAGDRPAEGGKPWPDYIAGTRDAVLGFVDQLEGEGGDQAAAWMAQSARIVETWYAETQVLEDSE